MKVIPVDVKRLYLETGSVDVTRIQIGIGYKECIKVLELQGMQIPERRKSDPGRQPSRKRCPDCRQEKLLYQGFSKCAKAKDGRQAICKPCAAVRKAGGVPEIGKRKPGPKPGSHHPAQQQIESTWRAERLERASLEKQAVGPKAQAATDAVDELWRRWKCVPKMVGGQIVAALGEPSGGP